MWKLFQLLLFVFFLGGGFAAKLRSDVSSNTQGSAESALQTSNYWYSKRRELKSNKDEVRSAVEARCDTVFWGDHIDHKDYLELIVRGAFDVFGGGGSLAINKLKNMLKDQAEAFGTDLVKKVVLDGKKLTGTLDGRTVYIDGGVSTYKHRAWSYKCCIKSWNFWCCCKKCGIMWTKTANTHQPYICVRKSRQPAGHESLARAIQKGIHNVKFRPP